MDQMDRSYTIRILNPPSRPLRTGKSEVGFDIVWTKAVQTVEIDMLLSRLPHGGRHPRTVTWRIATMLQLREAYIPKWPFGKVALFSSPGKALRHLCDHVLTRPEAHYWATLIPSFTDVVDPSDDDALYYFARSLWSNHPPISAVQTLYDGYTHILAQAITDAVTHGWYWAEREPDGLCWRGLGVSGTFVIWRERTIRTGMLLGYTAPPVTDDLNRPDGSSRAPGEMGSRKTNPLPRQHSWKYRGSFLRHDTAHYPPVARDHWKVRYHIFKKGAVRVRREFKHALQSGRVSEGGGYLGSLQIGVPDFDTWLRIQQPPTESTGPFSVN